jgi:hypothetical protein
MGIFFPVSRPKNDLLILVGPIILEVERSRTNTKQKRNPETPERLGERRTFGGCRGIRRTFGGCRGIRRFDFCRTAGFPPVTCTRTVRTESIRRQTVRQNSLAIALLHVVPNLDPPKDALSSLAINAI